MQVGLTKKLFVYLFFSVAVLSVTKTDLISGAEKVMSMSEGFFSEGTKAFKSTNFLCTNSGNSFNVLKKILTMLPVKGIIALVVSWGMFKKFKIDKLLKQYLMVLAIEVAKKVSKEYGAKLLGRGVNGLLQGVNNLNGRREEKNLYSAEAGGGKSSAVKEVADSRLSTSNERGAGITTVRSEEKVGDQLARQDLTLARGDLVQRDDKTEALAEKETRAEVESGDNVAVEVQEKHRVREVASKMSYVPTNFIDRHQPPIVVGIPKKNFTGSGYGGGNDDGAGSTSGNGFTGRELVQINLDSSWQKEFSAVKSTSHARKNSSNQYNNDDSEFVRDFLSKKGVSQSSPVLSDFSSSRVQVKAVDWVSDFHDAAVHTSENIGNLEWSSEVEEEGSIESLREFPKAITGEDSGFDEQDDYGAERKLKTRREQCFSSRLKQLIAFSVIARVSSKGRIDRICKHLIHGR